jgi:hypothetical protein
VIDLATCTLDEALAATEAALAADRTREHDPALPIYQWCALRKLDVERQKFDSGDRMALLGAVRQCANHDLPLPAWAAKAYIEAYDLVLTCRAKSWDEAFGTPYPKNSNLNAMRKRRLLRYAVFNEVRRLLNVDPRPPIDATLFETVGKMVRPPVGKTMAADLYYEALHQLNSAKL